jgi:hypothetical protein
MPLYDGLAILPGSATAYRLLSVLGTKGSRLSDAVIASTAWHVEHGGLFLLGALLSAHSSYSAITGLPRRCLFCCCYLDFLLGRPRRVRDSISKMTTRGAYWLLSSFMQLMSPSMAGWQICCSTLVVQDRSRASRRARLWAWGKPTVHKEAGARLPSLQGLITRGRQRHPFVPLEVRVRLIELWQGFAVGECTVLR